MLKRNYLILTLLIILILLLAIGSYLRFIQNKQLDAVANQLSAGLNVARLESVKRGVQVSVCPRADVKDAICGTSGNWSRGWLVFLENHRLLVNDPLPAAVTLTANTSIVIYNPTGTLGSKPLHIRIQPKKYCRAARIVTVSANGQLNIEQAGCKA